MATSGPVIDAYFNYSQGNFILRQDFDASGNSTYVGWAQPGTLTSDSRWRILRQTFNGSNQMTATAFPGGSPAFAFVWDNRATYSFS